MRRLVVDASLAVSLLFEEEHSLAAERIFAEATDLLAPELIRVEAAAAIWKRHRRGELPKEEADAAVRKILALPLQIHSSAGLIVAALDLAMQWGRTVYDSLYLALALKTGLPVVTADERLVNAFVGTPLERSVVWIGKCGRA